MITEIDDLLKVMTKVGATDLVLIPSILPMMRLADAWRPVDTPEPQAEDLRRYATRLRELLPDLDERNRYRFDIVHNQYGRFSVHLFGYPELTGAFILRHSAPVTTDSTR